MSEVQCPFDSKGQVAEFVAWHKGWQAGCAEANSIWNAALDRTAASGIEAATAGETVQLGSTEGESPTREAGDAK